ncbi:MAG TPA: hypothetical protein VMV14_01200 [Acidimicrobiales bacterium]|nr:hypothetical protein [Acidimicrobiales bacterium]
MSLIVLGVALEALLFLGVGLGLRSGRTTRRRQEDRFARAAADARRLAHNALIVDASIAELSELVIEESLREMGMEWMAEPI